MTESEWLGDEPDEGFYGTGLVVSEDGELAIVHAGGGVEDWHAYRVGESDALALSKMIRTVLG